MRVYAWLAGSLVLCKIALTFASLDFKSEGQRAMLQWPILLGVIGYGLIGVLLLRPAGLPGMGTSRRGAVIAIAHGLTIGVVSSVVDMLWPVAPLLGLTSMHHPLPEALPLYWFGAVFSEIWYHLLPVPLVMIAVARLTHDRERAFWIALIVLSAWEGRRFFTDPTLQTPVGALLTAVTYTANASEIWLFRRHGFLAAVIQRIASYSIWHIAWPAVQ